MTKSSAGKYVTGPHPDQKDWKEKFKGTGTVLLVIDPQNDVLDEKGNLSFWQVWKHAQETGAVSNLKRIITACRSADIPVIWAQQYRLAGERDIFPGTFDGDLLTLIRTLMPEAFLQDTWETELFHGLSDMIHPDDIVLGKHGSSMFEGTNLEKHLRVTGAEILITTGFLTDFCVEATVRSGADRGFIPVVISDACATQNRELHAGALERIGSFFGPVVSTDEMATLIINRHAHETTREPRTFNMEEVGKSLAQGLSLNDIVNWEQYVHATGTALLVVNPLDNPGTGGSAVTEGNDSAAPNAAAQIEELVHVCREKQISVLWLNTGSTHENEEGAHVLSDMVEAHERIISGPCLSAFEGTALEHQLTAQGITSLIVCGFATDLAVESTVRNASDRGYFTIIASDACAATSDHAHSMALERFDRLIGPVVYTENLVRFLREL